MILIDGTRIDQLKELRATLASAIECCDSARDLAALAKQFRDTIREIEEIEGSFGDDDEIEKLLAERENDGKSNPVRKNRAAKKKH